MRRTYAARTPHLPRKRDAGPTFASKSMGVAGTVHYFSRMAENPPAAQSAVDALSALAREARGTTPIKTIASKADVSQTAVSRLCSGKWQKEGLSKPTLERILRVMDCADETLERAGDLYDEAKAERHEPPAPTTVRYGLTPAEQEGRLYASIDRIAYEERVDGYVAGTIERIEPTGQRGNRWECAGRISHGELHLTFWPSSKRGSQASSTGHLAVIRDQNSKRPWAGFYIKLSGHPGNNPRLLTYEFITVPGHDDRLTNASSSVVVLDFDNTLAHGWIMRPWVGLLASRGVGNARAARDELEQLFADYETGRTMSHDRLADRAAELYADALSGVLVRQVEELAETFVSDYLEDTNTLFRYSRELVKGLRSRGLRPVLVTGAPAEVAKPLIRALNIERSFATVLHIADERFTGSVRSNRGVSRAKQAACDHLIRKQECDIIVAIGDSEGDRPMWDAAETSIRIGGDPDARDVTISGLELTQPLSDEFWSRISAASWLTVLDQTS